MKPTVTVEEMTPEQCREACLREVNLAREADSKEHMVMHAKAALIYARGAGLTDEPA